MSVLRLFAASAVFSSALAHLDINYPTSSWSFTEDQQEQGGVCGGGSRVTAVAWGTQNAFVSLSGDEGHSVRVRLAASNSTSENVTVSDASSFNINLSEGATFSSSGNLCLPINLPNVFITGSRATLYVEATGEGETVSSCAEVVLVPADSGASVAIEHGAAVINPSSGANYTTSEFYCSNSTIPARECSCHCHGSEAHCDDGCSADRLSEANEECAAIASGESHDEHDHDDHSAGSSSGECDCHCDGDQGHCTGSCTTAQESDAAAQCSSARTITGLVAAASSPTATASGSVGTTASAAAAGQTGGSNAAGKKVIGGGGLAAVLALAGAALF